MQTFQIVVNDTIADTVLKFLENLQESVKVAKVENPKLESDAYELWSDEEHEYISKVDLSTPLEDDEDYSKW